MKHCILVKYNDTVNSPEKKKSLLGEIRELFENTLQLDGVEQVNVYPCCIDRENRYDVMIEIGMDKAALPVYDDCKWHHIWKSQYACYVEKKAVFDYE